MSNSAPSGTDITLALTENRSIVLSANDFGFIDTDDNALLAVLITSLPITGTLSYDADGNGPNPAAPVTAGQSISRADLDAGKLFFTPAANTNGAAYASFSFQVQDDGGTAGGGTDTDPVANTITFDVTPVTPPDTVAKTVTGTDHLTIDPGHSLTVSGTAISWNSASTGIVIENSGTIESTASGGRAINAGGAAGGERTLTLINHQSGVIQSQQDAFRINVDILTGHVKVVNDGTILSTVSGQALDFDAVASATPGQIEIDNNTLGVIRAIGADGIRPGQNAIVNNSGLIYSGGVVGDKNDGVDWQAHSGTIHNMAGGMISGQRHGTTSDTFVSVINDEGGVILGRNGSGVGSDGTGKVVNHGTIIGAYDGSGNGDGDGVDIDGYAEIDNWGLIAGTGAAGVGDDGSTHHSEGVVLTNGGYVNNYATGVISGIENGLTDFGLTVMNEGKITGGHVALLIVDDSTVTNKAGGMITGTGADNRGIQISGGVHNIDNAGTISGHFAINVNGAVAGPGNVITNSGLITSDYAAIRLGAGDDKLIIKAGSNIVGLVDGGAGADQVVLEDGATWKTSTKFETLVVNGSATISGANGFTTVTLSPGAYTLSLTGSGALGTAALDFGGSDVTLKVGAGVSLANNPITNFGIGDALDLGALNAGAVKVVSTPTGLHFTDALGHTLDVAMTITSGTHLELDDDGTGHLLMKGTADGPDQSLTLRVAEDAYLGDAQMVVTVDGVQVGDLHTVTASHSAGEWQDITIAGYYINPGEVSVKMYRDAYGGPGQDRNLYVDKLTLNGDVYEGENATNTAGSNSPGDSAGLWNATGKLTFNTAPSTLTLRVAEDAFQGDAQFVVMVDGKQVGGIQTVTASHSGGQYQDVTVAGHFSNPSEVSVKMVGDAYEGPGQDRNLYVDSLTIGGKTYQGEDATNTAGDNIPGDSGGLFNDTGSLVFDTSPKGTVTVRVAEDAYLGDAKFVVMIDGQQIGGTQVATTAHGSGYQDITLLGDFDNPSHLSIKFTNDAYGGPGQDRNLYVDSVTVNGTTYQGEDGHNTAGSNIPGDAAALINSGGDLSFDFMVI